MVEAPFVAEMAVMLSLVGADSDSWVAIALCNNCSKTSNNANGIVRSTVKGTLSSGFQANSGMEGAEPGLGRVDGEAAGL